MTIQGLLTLAEVDAAKRVVTVEDLLKEYHYVMVDTPSLLYKLLVIMGNSDPTSSVPAFLSKVQEMLWPPN
jgi:hypothetical protein